MTAVVIRFTPRRTAGEESAAATPPDRQWEIWMAAAQAGDSRAYERLLAACLPLLRGVARRRLRDSGEAEDAVQDTLLTLHRLRHTYDPERPIRPWLVAICERRCVDLLRRQGRRRRREEAIEDRHETIASPGPPPDAASEARELRAAVAELPESQRQALALAKLEELPLAEASGRSGISIGALKIATHRAMKTLRRRLGAEDK